MAQASKKWRVNILRWDVYEVRNVEAATEDLAEERALDLYEVRVEDLEHVDGGVSSVDAEEEEA